MYLKLARLATTKRPLVFGDADQIAAYEYMERVAAIQRVIEGDDSDEHVTACRDALLEMGWSERADPEWRGH